MKDSWVFLWAFPKFDEIVGQVEIQTTSFEKLNLEPPCNFNQLHGDSNFKYAEISSPKILWSSKTIILAGELQFYQLQRKRPEKKRKKKKKNDIEPSKEFELEASGYKLGSNTNWATIAIT